jgi:hypothetical protein
MSHKRKIKILALLTLVIGFTLLLFVGEFVARLIRPDLVPSHQLKTIPDPLIGWKFLPNQEWTGKTEHGESREIKTNSIGFADYDHSLQPLPHTKRIAFLGDSFAAGTHVDFKTSFVRIAEAELNSTIKADKFEALNFGQSGFGTINEYLSWKHYALPFKPDIVVLCFFLGNDVANNLKEYSTESYLSPKFELTPEGLREVPFKMGTSHHADEQKQRNWVYRNILAPSLLYQQYKLFSRDIRAKMRGDQARKVKENDSSLPFWKRSYAPLDWQTYLVHPEPEFEAAWKITEALLLKLQNETQSANEKFYIALLPGVESLSSDQFQQALKKYPGIEKYTFDLDYPRQRLLQFTAEHKIATIDLTPVIQEELKTKSISDLYFVFDKHFSTQGHRVVGQAIAKHLSKDLSPQ